MDTSSDSPSPKGQHASEQDSLHHNVNQLNIHSPKVDPALRSPSVLSDATETGDSSQQSWVENIRVIERLRDYLKQRIEAHDFSSDDEEDVKHEHRMGEDDDDAHSLYPVLRAVQEGRD